jgi:hypothetical protein
LRTDSKVPVGFAPFGIQSIGDRIYVTYAKQNAQKHDDVSGQGNGFVDVFNVGGKLLKRLIRQWPFKLAVGADSRTGELR